MKYFFRNKGKVPFEGENLVRILDSATKLGDDFRRRTSVRCQKWSVGSLKWDVSLKEVKYFSRKKGKVPFEVENLVRILDSSYGGKLEV